jgi:hypothetical protein
MKGKLIATVRLLIPSLVNYVSYYIVYELLCSGFYVKG